MEVYRGPEVKPGMEDYPRPEGKPGMEDYLRPEEKPGTEDYLSPEDVYKRQFLPVPCPRSGPFVWAKARSADCPLSR